MKMFAVAENKELIEINKTVNVSLLKDSWIAIEKGLYKQAIAVKDIKNDDKPILFKSLPADVSKDDSEDYGINFGLISGGKAESENITFYATDSLSNDIDVILALGNKGDGTLLIAGGGSSEKNQISNVVITITDNAAIAEGGIVTATCNNKRWSSTIKNGKAKLYASEVGNYTITVVTTDAEPVTYTTMLVCPYFGQFSTDIYSGTLVVTCTEDGGNGKACNIRSCDDEYKPTDAYNLTQTFDTTLELTFLGIPAGKYLVTVDDKYVFFKEIVTIQNINSVQVELKQWLYKNGDQCMHNTGGWMKCKNTKTSNPNPVGGSHVTAVAGITTEAFSAFENDKIHLKTQCSSDGGGFYRGPSTAWYFSGTASVSNHIGTKSKFKMSLLKYDKCIVQASNYGKYLLSMRSGNENDANTNVSTPTILCKAPLKNSMQISSADDVLASIVLGIDFSFSQKNGGNTAAEVAVTNNEEVYITEIWLE